MRIGISKSVLSHNKHDAGSQIRIWIHDPDQSQILIDSSLILLPGFMKSVHSYLVILLNTILTCVISNLVNRQTNKPTQVKTSPPTVVVIILPR